jgi:CheY-like chemotaxis protein
VNTGPDQPAVTENGFASIERLHREVRRAANSFLGITELLLDTSLTQEQRQYVEVLRSTTDRLLSVTGHVARIAENGSERLPAFVNFDLRDAVEQTAKLMDILGSQSGVGVITLIAGAGPWLVTGDKQQFEHILVSLIAALLKASAPGCILVLVDRGEHDDIELEIIAPPGAAGSFDESGDSQADLSIELASRAVRAMGGTFLVSARDSHAIVSYTLPLPDATGVRPAIPGPKHPQAVSATARVLLAEDSPDNQFTIRAYLKDQPYTLQIAEDGFAALDYAKSGTYAVILMDIEMPGLSGIEVMKAIREWELSTGRPPTPIIALTAHAENDDNSVFLNEGFNAYLTKPARKHTVLTALERYAAVGRE